MKKLLLVFALCVNFGFSKSLVVLDPSIVEILYMLEAEDEILAISTMLNSEIYPAKKTKKLPSVGNYSKPSIEKIVALKPKLVVINRYSTSLKEDLAKFGIKTASFEASSISDIYKNIEEVGKIVNKENKSKELIQNLKDKINNIKKMPQNANKAIFFYSTTPLMAFSSKTLPGDIFRLLGLKNLSDGIKGERPIISQEYLLTQNPNYILVVSGMANTDDLFKANPLLEKTDASKNKKIFYVKSASVLRGTPRIIDEIEKLANRLNE